MANSDPTNTFSLEDSERYQLLNEIGRGSYAPVYRAWDEKDEKYVAIKLFNLEDVEDTIDDIHQEIAIMTELNRNRPQLVTYLSSYVVECCLWIVMEYLEGGSVADIMKLKGPLPESCCVYILRELLTALEFVHSELKIHRDVKAGNILVSGTGRVTLADFGVTGRLKDTSDKRTTKIGTPFWMAPEVIMEAEYDGCADIWSTGITAIEMLTGFPPYASTWNSNVQPLKVIFLIPTNPPPRLEGDQFSALMKDFVAQCLQKEPNARPIASALLEHAIFRDAVKPVLWTEIVEEVVAINNAKWDREPRYDNLNGLASESDSSGEWDFSSTGRPGLIRSGSSQRSDGSASGTESTPVMSSRSNGSVTEKPKIEFADFGMRINSSGEDQEPPVNPVDSLSPSNSSDTRAQRPKAMFRSVQRSLSVNAADTGEALTPRMVMRTDSRQGSLYGESMDPRMRGMSKMVSEGSYRGNPVSPSGSDVPARPQIRRQKSVQINDVPTMNLKFYQGDSTSGTMGVASRAPGGRGIARMRSTGSVETSIARGFRLDSTMRSTDSSSSNERPGLLRRGQSAREFANTQKVVESVNREQQQAVAALNETSDSDEEERSRLQKQQPPPPSNHTLPPLPLTSMGKSRKPFPRSLSVGSSSSNSLLSADEYDMPILHGDPLQQSFDTSDDHHTAPSMAVKISSPRTAERLGMRQTSDHETVYADSPTAAEGFRHGPFASVLRVLKESRISSSDIGETVDREEYSPIFLNVIKPTLQHLRDQVRAQYEDQSREISQKRQQHALLKAKIEQSGGTPNPRALKMLGSLDDIEQEAADLVRQNGVTTDVITVLIAALTALDISSKGELSREFVETFADNLDADLQDFADEDENDSDA